MAGQKKNEKKEYHTKLWSKNQFLGIKSHFSDTLHWILIILINIWTEPHALNCRRMCLLTSKTYSNNSKHKDKKKRIYMRTRGKFFEFLCLFSSSILFFNYIVQYVTSCIFLFLTQRALHFYVNCECILFTKHLNLKCACMFSGN